MNKELITLRNNALTTMRHIEDTKSMAEKFPESPVDWAKILKAHQNLLDAIHDRICDIVINEYKLPLWKKLFRK